MSETILRIKHSTSTGESYSLSQYLYIQTGAGKVMVAEVIGKKEI